MTVLSSKCLTVLLLWIVIVSQFMGFNANAGTWSELPNTKIKDVGPPTPPPPSGPLKNVINAWSGAAMDTTNNRLFIWGGGHKDYAGNEIYVLDLTAKKMERLWGPSPFADDYWDGACPNAKDSKLSDGTPMSRHTYGGLAYLEHVNLFWIYGGSRACGSGGFGKDTWTFDPSTQKWQNESPSGKNPQDTLVLSAYDPVTKKVFVHNGRHLFSYEYGDNKTDRVNEWVRLSSSRIPSQEFMSMTLDPSRRMLVFVGGWKKPGTFLIDIDGSNYEAKRLETTNGKVIEGSQSPGVAYDPGTTHILAWDGSRRSKTPSAVWSLDVETGQWTQIESQGSGMSVNSGSTGTFGRWRYVPVLDQFVAVIDVKQNAWLFSTSGEPKTTASAELTPEGSSASPSPKTTTPEPVPSTSSGSSLEKNVSAEPAPAVSSSSPRYLDIPVNTWVPRRLSRDRTRAPSGGKHQRLAHNPDDGLIYFNGGDHAGTPGHSFQSSRNEMYTYDILTDTWTLIQPYCRTDGTVQPAGPDEHGWSWDSRRKVFWLVPGYSKDHSKGKCRQSTLIKPTVMSYSPTKGVWIHENRKSLEDFRLGQNGNHKFSQYDEESDELIVMGEDRVLIYNIEDDKWRKIKFRMRKTLRLNHEYTAMDPKERIIYAIDRSNPRLAKYDIEDESIDFLAKPPRTVYNQAQIYWDSVNRVILWFDHNQPSLGVPNPAKLHVYHPDSDTWEVDKQVDNSLVPDGVIVRGNEGVFDPYQNVLMVMGGLEPPNMYIFLYRYAEGSGQPSPIIRPPKPTKAEKSGQPARIVPPSNPTDLRIF